MFGLLPSRRERDARTKLNQYEQELSRRGARALRQYEEELGARGNRAKRRLRELGEDAHEHWDHARQRAGAEGQRAWEFTEHTARDIDEHVHSNAWSYIGVGVAVGVVAGLLLGRRV
ncbi:glycine zipper domain-containing protein [Kushneria phosphatilytica]|uniref:DUF883 family protein n=1 Tax=Kushneria phosphatilytica TaxID=657387 RepID=A0A1S1NRT4_9GAMM|nr:DUF883 family protein [Kushneria phosphatilytica]OHV07802.1 hypothetical protein BH688_16640 [Kushneria phosphatilytica]QEL10309.1 DUF883 family protein [Kushneria phosphatilytica]